jgi:hypothetical protein
MAIPAPTIARRKQHQASPSVTRVKTFAFEKFAIFWAKVNEKTRTAVTTVRKLFARSFVSVKAYFKKSAAASVIGIVAVYKD